jgi:hypothetical protein
MDIKSNTSDFIHIHISVFVLHNISSHPCEVAASDLQKSGGTNPH